MMGDEQAKAIQEVAKTAAKGIDATQEAGRFFDRFLSGPLDEGAGIITDYLQYRRWERRVRLVQRAREFLRASGLSEPTRSVPMKIAFPLLEGALLEEDDSLQDRWAALLVNAGNANFGAEIQRVHLRILEEISPFEAGILDVIYSVSFKSAQHEGILTDELPRSARIRLKSEDVNKLPLPPEDVMLAIGNLARLGCLRLPTTWGGGESFKMVNPTVLGRSFVNACRLPGSPPPPA